MFRKKKPDLSYDDLLSQRRAIDEELAKRTDVELELLKEKLTLIAEYRGESVQALFKEPRREKKKRDVPIRYRNTDNPQETWSGRGKPPRWLQEKLNAGAQKEEFLNQ